MTIESYMKLQGEERYFKKIPLWSIVPRQRYYYLVILVLEFEEVLGIV